jgi:hypothetical protein
MTRISARRPLAATIVALVLGLGAALLALTIAERASTSTSPREIPSVPRTTPSLDGSEHEAIMEAAYVAAQLQQWLEQLQEQETATTLPVTPS